MRTDRPITAECVNQLLDAKNRNGLVRDVGDGGVAPTVLIGLKQAACLTGGRSSSGASWENPLQRAAPRPPLWPSPTRRKTTSVCFSLWRGQLLQITPIWEEEEEAAAEGGGLIVLCRRKELQLSVGTCGGYERCTAGR